MTTYVGQLRSIRDDELALMLSWRNSPNVRANMYTHHEISLREHLAWWAKTKATKRHQYFMYERLEKPLGIVAFIDIGILKDSASWAFYADPNAPAGTGSKMEFLALEYAFRTLSLQSLSCEVLSFNIPVLNLHKKFGFKIVKTIKNGHTTNGNHFDIHQLQLTISDWEGLRSSMLNRVTER